MRRTAAAFALCLALAPVAQASDDPRPKTESLSMTDPIPCRSIRGYEDYDVLDPAEVTPDEKLLIYVRSRHHAYQFDDELGKYCADLIEDVNIRRKGQKKVLYGRDKVVDLKISSVQPPENLYLGTTLGLKGIPPGEYEADLILKDMLDPGSKTEKSLSFRILPRKSGAGPNAKHAGSTDGR